MDQGPLVMDEIEAGAKLIRKLDDFAPIKVAFWLRRDEEDERRLYIASDQFSSANRPDAYGEVQRILQEMPLIFLDPSQVSLLAGDNRLAIAAKQMSDQYPDRRGLRLRSIPFAERYIADGYIYPSPMTAGFPRSFA